MTRIILTILSYFAVASSMFAQSTIENYMKNNTRTSNANDIKIDFNSNAVYANELVFFGFIHGSEIPQKVDFSLLKDFAENGTRYYAPEVDQSMAYILNHYLISGDEKALDFVLYFYGKKIYQDASLQFRDKWKKIYEFNLSLPDEEKLTVLGTDKPFHDKRLAITHLAHLVADLKSDHLWIDSLKHCKGFDIDKRSIWSGKPAYETAVALKKPTTYFIYPADSKYHFAERFFEAYHENKQQFLSAFGPMAEEAKRILEVKDLPKREYYIFQQFEEQILPLINNGQKIYANYGYAHIQQSKINGRTYVAGMLREAYPDLKMASVQGLLAKSKALKKVKKKRNGETVSGLGFEFEGMEYAGFKSSKSWDGHGIKESPKGLKELMRVSKGKELTMLSLIKEGSPFHRSDYFSSYEKGGKNWKVEEGSSTSDYFQYVILMQNSGTNVPYQELHK